MENLNYEKFLEEFNNLSASEKIAIYNNYCLIHGYHDDMVYEFDEEFFDNFFSNESKMEVCRATFFGNIHSWDDEFIYFNGYGNLESLSEYDVDNHVEGYLEDIFENKDTWEDYIDIDDVVDNEEEE